MKLYYLPGACSLADLIVLQWIGEDHEPVRMDLGSLRSPDYLALNAGGTVPLLVHDDLSLTENVAILGYLADLHPEARLLGDGSPRARAEVMRWLGFLNSDVHKAFIPIFKPQRFLPDSSQSSALADTARRHVSGYLKRLDEGLEGRNWLTGERSIADPYLFVLSRWAAATKIDMRGLDNIARFSEHMNSDSGVRTALALESSLGEKTR
ncbi:glutathione S-transferase N-terminal domain-containing protein [Variovorax sp. OV329]|uniref:glutathione S-transferase N-terminal domain-containing protein n=1 Tax=Variovorax sp. OV329 TaxID=1882825 RepID=UPI0008EDCB6B|nr:glutathione S-transferase N-terminal domain-containing protein [Variovorax sp. OV329]SFN50207.1 glutathione S-transferase [Variovorax sp. OV329]